MRIEILNTGTELLLGNTVNTHAAWVGRELFKLGLRIARQTTVPDGEAIRDAISESLARADALIVTGGLGPTSDDITREITAEVLGLELITDQAALRSLKAFFDVRGRPMADANLKQALAPVGAVVLPNPNGTAPGLYIPPGHRGPGAPPAAESDPLVDRTHPDSARRSGSPGSGPCAIFLLPGPPRELYPMFHAEVVPRLRALSGIQHPPAALELKFTGVGESDFHQSIDARLAEIPGLEYGYCAHIGEVDLRLIGPPEALEQGRRIALQPFGGSLVSDDGASLEAVVVRNLTALGFKLATAESCTGGLIAHRITNVPGSSSVFTHGFVTYANEAKLGLLEVDPADLSSQGAVSETVARQMAAGALKVSRADIAVSVTGIAGPDGGSPEKPVGTAWIGLATRIGGTTAFKVFHPRNRHDFKLAVSQAALDALRKALV